MDIITQNFMHTILETELLEACGWDEEEADRLLLKVTEVLSTNLKVDGFNNESIVKLIRNKLAEDASEEQLLVLEKIVKTEIEKAISEIARTKWNN